MNVKERVQAALRRQRPDRIPRYEIFLPGFIEKWQGKRKSAGNFSVENFSIYDAYPRIDIGTVLATQEGPFLKQVYRKEQGDNIIRRDSWGRVIRERKGATFFEVVENVLKDKSALENLEFENPADTFRQDLTALAERMKLTAGRFAPVSGVMGLFMPSYYMRGEVPFMMDLMDDESFCRTLIDRLGGYVTAQAEAVVRLTDTSDMALWVYDDFGTPQGPLISPALFEKYFMPIYRRMTDYLKGKGVENIILHYDGNCWPILDMIVEAGFTGIQGIYPGAGMTIPSVKAKYGSKLCLIGGMCNTTILAAGSRGEIEKSVAEIVEVARDGGVIIGSHSIDHDIPPEQYDIYYDCVSRFDAEWDFFACHCEECFL
jgi:uroporphyrinogen-III decarboxylase